MSISSLYDKAKQYADKIMLEQPSFFSGSGGSLCLILTENQEIVFGITSIRISDGRIITVPSEYNAIASMVVENKKKAVQMVILSFYDYSVCQPNAYCFNLLLRAGAGNADCQIAISPEESVSASDMKENLAVSAENSDNKDVPSEFLAGFDFGEDNPFDSFIPDEESQLNIQAQRTVPANMSEQPAPQQNPYMQPDMSKDYQQPFPQQPYVQPQYPHQNPYIQPANMGMEYQQPFPQQPYMQPQYPHQNPYIQPANMGMEYQQPFPQQPYMQPQYSQNPYVPPYVVPYPQQAYPQQFPQQPYVQPQQSIHIDNTAPYPVNPQNSIHNSQHIPENNASDANSDIYTDSEQSIMAKKLANLINDSSMASEADNQLQNTQRSNEISKEEMLRRANQDKKAAKGGFFGKR